MYRCRIPIAVLLALTLPLQSFARGSCYQAGQRSCCSVSVGKSDAKAKSCCSRIPTNTEPTGCKHCAAVRARSSQSSFERCTCHCKKDHQKRPATVQRRQFEFESILASQAPIFVVASPLAPSPLKVEFADRSPGLRLHAIHCVWLN